MFLAHFITLPTLTILWQESDRGSTPIWVIAILILLVILLFWWGRNYPSKTEVIQDDHAHDSHGHVAVTESAYTPVAHHEEPVVVEIASETAVATPDHLQRIEGIGPKIETILYEAGISTFAQLAATPVSQLEKIVREDAGLRIAFPDSWPQQAQLAAAGQWDALQKLQDELIAGRVD